MAIGKYHINRSLYTEKKLHRKYDGGTIYERDKMTLSGPNSWDGDVFKYGDGNFKFAKRYARNGFRKHKYGTWMEQDTCQDKDRTVWTLDCTAYPDITAENRIVLKPDYSSILDFTYYGSSTDLFANSVNGIIKRFPAELVFSENGSIDGIELNDVINNTADIATALGTESEYMKDVILQDNLAIVSNPFMINVSDEVPKSPDSDINGLRYLSSSYTSYEIVNEDGTRVNCINEWQVLYKNPKACKDFQLRSIVLLTKGMTFGWKTGKSLLIFEYMYKGQVILVADKRLCSEEKFRIRPIAVEIERFYNENSDFQNLLLNRRSIPLYTCTLDNYFETDEDGLKRNKRQFTWPVSYGGWNLDIESESYSTYYGGLFRLCETCDEYFSDNMMKMMVHDPIKTMDQTFSNYKSDEDRTDFWEGTTMMNQVLKAYAWFFDEFKRYAANIGTSNIITYDGNNNCPDYFLSDTLENAGWDVYSTVSSLDSGVKVKDLYGGDSSEYGVNDVNTLFMRELKLNSKGILSRKGTRHAIEMLLSLFGLKSSDYARLQYIQEHGTDEGFTYSSGNYDYEIAEYDYVAKPKSDIKTMTESAININKRKYTYDGEGISVDELQGLPVLMVNVEDKDGEGYSYMIPWFRKGETMDGHPYFQMYGGWGKVYSRTIDGELSDKGRIYSTPDFSLYGETVKYLNVVGDMKELLGLPYDNVSDGDIYYVVDTSDIETYIQNQAGLSHYFYLHDRNGRDKIGTEGWENIRESDIKDGTGYGLNVLYLESLIDDTRGNNPHVGYGRYDNGEAYLDYFRGIFKGAVDEGQFMDNIYDCDSGEMDPAVKECGFDLTEYVDNHKVWYFTDAEEGPKFLTYEWSPAGQTEVETVYRVNRLPMPSIEYVGMKCRYGNDIYECVPSTAKPENKIGKDSTDGTFGSKLETYDFETKKSGVDSEASANSVINSKKLKITFVGFNAFVDEFRKYLETSIMPYLSQVIPSTSILDISIVGEDSQVAEIETVPIAGVVGDEQQLYEKYMPVVTYTTENQTKRNRNKSKKK